MSSYTRGVDRRVPAKCFHFFPRLPAEIRWQIWEMAICENSTTPRIYYYQLFNNNADEYRRSFLLYMMSTYPELPKKPHPRTPSGKLKAIFPPALRSYPSLWGWTRANRLLYVWDAGLQNACRESREILCRHRKKVPEGPFPKSSNKITAYDQAGEVYLRVCSRCDIICFRFSPEDMEACVELRWDALISCLPFFRLPRFGDVNLALEFHDSWNEGLGMTRESMLKYLPEASERGLAMRAHWAWMKGEIPRWTRMYLIDRDGPPAIGYDSVRENDYRYYYDSVYTRRRTSCKPHLNITFTDGKHSYAESYVWRGRNKHFRYKRFEHDIPILIFTWKVRWLCLPPQGDEDYKATTNLPGELEHFFKVLRRLRTTKRTG